MVVVSQKCVISSKYDIFAKLKNKKMEITQAQKYEILEHELLNGAGLEEILKKCLEILMKSEREIHNENYLDYSNGYRYRKIYGST